MDVRSIMSLRFLDFPAEIRDQVYAELLSSRINRFAAAADDVITYSLHVAVLRVSRQVHREARAVLRRCNTFVCIETPWRQAELHVASEGRVPILASGDHAERFADYTMRVVIDAPGMLHAGGLSKFVICLQDLPRFTRMWHYSDLSYAELNSHLRLTLKLVHGAPSGDCPPPGDQAIPLLTQSALLLPFGKVKNLCSFDIDGPHSAQLEKELRKEMSEPYPTPEFCLEEATRLKDLGNLALKASDFHRALDLYRQAFLAIHIVIAGRRRDVWADVFFEKELEPTSANFAGQHGGVVRTILRIRLVANTVHAYLKLGEYTEAKFWGMRSINIMREALGNAADVPRPQFPAASEWGKIYFRTALACKALGNTAECRELLGIAAAWLPGDPFVRREVADLSPGPA